MSVATIAFHVPLIHSISELDLVQIPMPVIEETDIHAGQGFYKITGETWENWNRARCVGSRPEFFPFTQSWRFGCGVLRD